MTWILVEEVQQLRKRRREDDGIIADLSAVCDRLRSANAKLVEACEAGLARIESDIESGRHRTVEGDLLRAAVAAAKETP